MRKTYATKILSLVVIVLYCTGLFAQTAFDGNALTALLGKSSTGAEFKELKDHYHCDMVNETHYTSKEGIELMVKGDVLSEIHLFTKNAVYGGFTGKLPDKLNFGMSSAEVKGLLGKPVVNYISTGYCEFELAAYTVSCWFEGGKLTQVGFAVK